MAVVSQKVAEDAGSASARTCSGQPNSNRACLQPASPHRRSCL